jgi:hypothetical protein
MPRGLAFRLALADVGLGMPLLTPVFPQVMFLAAAVGHGIPAVVAPIGGWLCYRAGNRKALVIGQGSGSHQRAAAVHRTGRGVVRPRNRGGKTYNALFMFAAINAIAGAALVTRIKGVS